MGYTHYIYRDKETGKEAFIKIAADIKKIYEYCENRLGIKLADGLAGKGTRPEADEDIIRFNGSDEQPSGIWTSNEDIQIPWPDNKAGYREHDTDPISDKVSGNWFAGSLLKQRCAPIDNLTGMGEGSYETFVFERISTDMILTRDDEMKGKYFSFCKTAYRPYDVAVTAVMICIKHYCPEIIVHSDGEMKDWMDGIFMCNELFGYGFEFHLGKNEPVLK